jgi:single-strand DNA-binding protein
VDRYVTKGKQLYIEGSIRTRTYEQDGQRKYFTEIHAQTMEMLGSRQGADAGAPRDDFAGVAQGFPDDTDDVPF